MAICKKHSIKLSILITVFAVICLSGCFSEWQGDLARIVISFGGAGRASYDSKDNDTHQKLRHDIVLTSATERLTFNRNGTTFEAYVAPGSWNIKVNSWDGNNIYASGSENVILKAGQDNKEIIKMYQAHLVKFNSAGGSPVPDQVVIHKRHAVRPANPTKPDYTFVEWHITNENEQGERFDFEKYEIEKDTYLIAEWIDEGHVYVIIEIQIPGIGEWKLVPEQGQIIYVYADATTGNFNKTFEVVAPEKYDYICWYVNGDTLGPTSPTYTFIQKAGVYEITLVVKLKDTEERISRSFTVIVRDSGEAK
jgi:hypothetical protein